MERIAASWGNLLAMKKETESLKNCEIAYLLIQTGCAKEIDDNTEMEFESYFVIQLEN